MQEEAALLKRQDWALPHYGKRVINSNDDWILQLF